MCMKKSKLSSRIVAMILSALTSLVSVGAMFENSENHEPEQYDEFDNETNPEYDNLKQRLAIGLDDFKKKVNNADFKDLDEEFQYVEDLKKTMKDYNENDPAILGILNDDINQKMELINNRYKQLQCRLNLESELIVTDNAICEENEEGNDDLHFSMRDDKSSNPILNEIPNFEEEIKSGNLNISEIIPDASTDTKFLGSISVPTLNLIDDKKNNQLLEENGQFANNKLNNVGISNDQSGSVIHEDGSNLEDGEEKSPDVDENADIAAGEAEEDDEPYDSKPVLNEILKGNGQFANNTLNNVGISNNQYSNEVISSNAHAEDYDNYEDYVTSECILVYNPNESIIGTQFDRNIKAKIGEIVHSKHDFALHKIRVGDIIVCVVIKDLTDRCAFRYLDKGQLLREIGPLMCQWDGILSCVINSIKFIVNLDGNLVSNKTQESNNSKFNYEVSKLL